MAPRADLVAISTNFFDSGILGAVEYMMKKSDELGKPAVLNMSLGGQFGPHDGTELISQGIDAAINTGKVHVVIAAGNEGTDAAHGEYIHAEGTVAAGASVTHEFVVPTYTANSGTGNDVIFFNIWYQGNDRLTIQVITPGGLSWSAASGSNNNGTFSNTSDGAIYIDNASAGSDPENGDRLGLIQIFDNSSTAPPRAGTWKIVVTGATVAESGHFDNWLYVSQLGSTSAYFSAASGNLEELVAIPGVTNRAITVAAYSTKTSWTDYLNRTQTAAGAVLNDLAYFSSPGPSRDDPGFITGRQKPEISAPGFGVVSSFSANATGFSSSIYRNQDQVHLMLWGTSMATPQIVGAVALLLEKNPKLTAAQVKSALMNTARKDAFTGGATNFRWGAGKLDIQAAANTVTQPSHAFDLFPSSFSRYALPNTAAEYIATIRNQGALADSYILSASGNLWPTTFFNAAGTTPITNTGTVQPGATVQFRVRVAVPNGTPANQQDRATVRATSTGNAGISDAATVVTRTPGAIPFVETFATAILDSVRWVLNSGPAKADTAGIAEPSPPYSLNLDGDESGGDEIHSQALNLAGMSGVQLEYFYQRTGRGNSPETGEDLWVDYLNATGQWVNLRQYLGSGPDMTTFEKEIIALPANAHHAFFQLRFRNLATAGPFDDWFVDNIKLTPPPDIAVRPDSFLVRMNWGQSVTRNMIISNSGLATLDYSIFISYLSTAAAARYQTLPPGFVSDEQRYKVADASELPPEARRASLSTLSLSNNAAQAGSVLLWSSSPNAPYWTSFKNALQAKGFTVVQTDVRPIAPLPSYVAVFISEPQTDLTTSEIAALQSYIAGGGKIIDMSDSFISSINPFLALYGVTRLATSASGTASYAHTIFQGVGDLTLDGGNWDNVLTVAAPSRAIATVSGQAVVSMTQNEQVLVFGEDSQFTDFAGSMSDPDNQRLLNNIIDWFVLRSSGFLSITPTAGDVAPGDSDIVAVTFDSRKVLPGKTHKANINILSNDPDESPLVVPAQMIVNPEPYFVVVNPPDSKANGFGKDVVAHALRIFNYGQNSDSYTLQLAGNKWKTQAFDSTGKTLLTKTPIVAAGGNIKILVQVTVDSLARGGTQDTVSVAAISAGNAARLASAKLTTVSRGTRGTIPFVEKFPAATLDPVKWPVNNGPAVVDTLGTREPSPPYSLDFNGTDEVQSQVFDLSGAKNLVMRYFYEMGGGGDLAETGNDLLSEYLDSRGIWQPLQRHLGGGSRMTAYVLQQFTLPDSAYHRNFALRFRTTGDAGSDNWFVDDISILLPPDIAVTYAPVPFDFILNLGDSTKGSIKVKNAGKSELNFSITDHTSTTASPLMPASAKRRQLEALFQEYQSFTALPPGNESSPQSGAAEAGDGAKLEARSAVNASSIKFAESPSSALNIVLLQCSNDLSFNADVQNKLLATGLFASVASIDLRFVTPKLSELLLFNGALIEGGSGAYADKLTLSNVLADYVDAGGGLVTALFVTGSGSPQPWVLSGRFLSNGYYAIDPGGQSQGTTKTLGVVYDPGHPIMQGVKSCDGGS
jgi:subtilisin family serine protease